MTKDDPLQGVREFKAILRGELKPVHVRTVTPAEMQALRRKFKPAAVAATRTKLGLTQDEFARMIGVPRATLRNWEQGRTKPEGPAGALLRVAERNPQAVVEALHGSSKRTGQRAHRRTA